MKPFSITPTSAGNKGFSPRQLALIKQTCARTLQPTEFDTFIEQCAAYDLNPLIGQAYALLLHADDPKRRRMNVIPSINGLRSLAARTGRYRPDEEPARFEWESSDPDRNPEGLKLARVRVHIQDSLGAWYPVEEEAYWKEYAPLREVWDINPETGRREPTGAVELSGQWGLMPRVMLSKCAEARALRRAFPELNGLYVQEEMDQAIVQDQIPICADQGADAGSPQDENIGRKKDSAGSPAKGDLFAFFITPDDDVHHWTADEVMRRVQIFYQYCTTLDLIDWFERSNRVSLQAFWTKFPAEAFELKKHKELALARLMSDKPQPSTSRSDAEVVPKDQVPRISVIEQDLQANASVCKMRSVQKRLRYGKGHIGKPRPASANRPGWRKRTTGRSRRCRILR